MVSLFRATSGSQQVYYTEFDNVPSGSANPTIVLEGTPFNDFHDRKFAPIALYQLADNNLDDDSGYNRHLTAVANVTTSSFGWKAGTLAFEGHASSSNSIFSTSGAISVFGLTKLDSISTAQVWMVSCDAGTELEADNIMWGIARINDDIRYFHENGAGTNNIFDVADILVANRWYHIGFTRAANGTFVRVYLDGIEVGSTTLANAPTGGSNSKLHIGDNANTGNQWQGQIQSIAIFDKELTRAQVRRLYQKVTTGF